MARYIPTDDMTRFLAREVISAKVRNEFERVGLTVSIGELEQDGSCRVNLWKQAEDAGFLEMLDGPKLDGRAWVDDRRAVEYDFGDELGQFLIDNAR
jgi:hypothetical protein